MPYPRSPLVIALAKKRQPFCRRCLCRMRLIGHHVWAIGDCGPDTVENVDFLCRDCHRVWHGAAERLGMPYEQFVRTVPALAMMFCQATNDQTEYGRSRTVGQFMADFAVMLDAMARERGITRSAFPEAWNEIPNRSDLRHFSLETASVRVT